MPPSSTLLASSGALLPRIPPQITQLLCLSPNSKISVSLRKHDGDRKAIPSSLRQCPCTYSPCMGSVKRLCANCMRTGCTKRRRVTAATNVWLVSQTFAACLPLASGMRLRTKNQSWSCFMFKWTPVAPPANAPIHWHVSQRSTSAFWCTKRH